MKALVNNVQLSQPIYVELPAPELLAQIETVKTYWKAIHDEIKIVGGLRPNSVIPSIINTPQQAPEYMTNPSRPSIGENCDDEGKVWCDMHTEASYGIRLRKEISCDVV